jgi:AraC family transcriptional regulator, glycine betaine-responsive activator
MQATIENPLDRTVMARFLSISPRHLDRLFRQHLHVGFLQFYRGLRLQHARQLLEQSPLSILEIAVATGFSSTSHFSSAFKAQFGTSPARKRGLSERERKHASS